MSNQAIPDGWYLYTTPWACAGVAVKDGKIIDAAPIYKKMIGWNAYAMKRYKYEFSAPL